MVHKPPNAQKPSPVDCWLLQIVSVLLFSIVPIEAGDPRGQVMAEQPREPLFITKGDPRDAKSQNHRAIQGEGQDGQGQSIGKEAYGGGEACSQNPQAE